LNHGKENYGCTGEKIERSIDAAEFTGGYLCDASLELRDVNTREDWWEVHGSRVPVLCVKEADGTLIELPRPHPRLNAQSVGRHISKHLPER
jgi:hypothetical protein